MQRQFLAIIAIVLLVLVWSLTDRQAQIATAPKSPTPGEQIKLLAQQALSLPETSEERRRLLAQVVKIRNRYLDQSQPTENPEALIEAFANIKTNHLGQTYQVGYRERALAKARNSGLKVGELPWVERGPGNVSGRVRTLVIDVSDASGRTWFAASIGGGIWMTTNAGNSWEIKTPDFITLSTTTLAQSLSDPDVLYAGTGMGYGRVVDLQGSGIWKSVDHGETWSQLASTANGELMEATNRVIVDPNDPDVVLVCANDGFSHLNPRGGVRQSAIFKSTDGGQSWRSVFDSDAFFGNATDNRVQQLLADPTDFNRLYATVNEVGVILSDDAGETWQVSANNFALPQDVGVASSNGFGLAGISVRTEMAIAPSDPNRLYAAVERPRGIADLFMSSDRGQSWQLLNDTSGDPNWFNAFGQSGASGYTAGWFDNTIAVDPTDRNVVFVGGVNIYRVDVNPGNFYSTTTPIAWWTSNSQGIPRAHADHHHLNVVPALGTPYAIVDGNDGGVALSTDGGASWRQLGGMVTTQFYGVDKMPGANVYVSGSQDNGSWRSGNNPGRTSNWTFVKGGDGFEVAWNAGNANQVIATSQGGNYGRSTDGGFSFQTIPEANAGISPFISKIANSKADPELVFTVGFNGIKRSDDFGLTWTLTPITGNWLGYRPFDNVEISIADPQVVWISSRMDVDPPSGLRGGIHVSTDGGLSFSEVSQNLPSQLTEASGIGTHPLDAGTAYMLFATPGNPKVMRTTDFGQTWTDLSGFDAGKTVSFSANGFPDLAVYSLLVMPHDTEILWAGTDIGLVVSEDGGQSWQVAETGLPHVAVFELSIVDGQILAATQGRGIWTVDLPELADYQPPDVTLSPRLKTLALQPDGKVLVEAELRSGHDQTDVRLGADSLTVLGPNDSPRTVTFEFLADQPETLSMQIIADNQGREYRSAVKSLSVYPVGRLDQLSANLDTNSDADRFISDGFSLITPNGFSNQAWHTAHPYSANSDHTLQFSDAIVMPCSNATLAFDEVAIMEPGGGNGQFGNPLFFDFVGVEASRDGIAWFPVADGYDARDNSVWLSTFNTGGSGDESQYRRRNIDLSNVLDPGERVFLRFRMFADSGLEGWGWVIDNIELFPSNTPVDDSCLVVAREGITGAWFDPDHDGEGWLIEALPDGRATVYWFTYPPGGGGQNWLIGTGQLANGSITLDADNPFLRPDGASFGDSFDPSEVVLNDWGTATFRFDGCGNGTMDYTSSEPGFDTGTLALSRLTDLSGLDCGLTGPQQSLRKLAAVGVPLAGVSGSWFNPEQPGHGWIVQILDNGGVLVVWFVYSPEGEQAWIIASADAGAVTESGFVLDAALITEGGVFGPNFDPANVQRIPWGTLSFQFDSCTSGTMSYDSTLAGYGSGSHFMSRLSNLAGARCDL
jgi:hypothetical protein